MTDDSNPQIGLQDESARLWKHNAFIEDFMDPDYGLLDQLLEMGGLSRREIHDVKSERTFEKRNTKIVEYIAQHSRFGKLILALRNTNQKHLANYLIADGVYRPTFGDDWPLTEAIVGALNRNQLTLIDSLDDIDHLSVAMYSADIINNRHKDTIHSQPTNHEKSEVLLDIMVRRSRADYSKTIECLEESNQHVVEILKSRGVVVQVIANLETAADNEKMEEEIAARTNYLLRDQERVEAIYEIQSEGLIGAKFGHSVALYFDCESSNELNRLWNSMESGRLTDLVDKYFNRLLSTEHQCKVRLKWSKDDYAVKQSILDEVSQSSVGPEAVTVSQPPEQSSPKKIYPEDPSQSRQAEEVDSNPCAGKLQVESRVYGVTKLNRLIYVLCRQPHVIYVFSDEQPFKQMPEIKINELKFEGYDISACSISSCLYVSDTGGSRIFKIPVEDPSQMKSWMDEMTSPWTLSVCRITGDVLIARNKQPIVLELYHSDAVKIYSVQLSADMVTLKHAVLASAGRFVIIHKWKDIGAWGISEVNREGERVCCFKHKEKSKMLYNPCHLALDDDARVIVTDLMKNRVVRFDSDLNWQDIILTQDKDGLQEPLRLFYDLEKRQLIVGQENGTVAIYSI